MRSAVCVLCQKSDGTFLSVSRRDDKTKWGLPGGKVDDDESNVEAIQRELMEETGVMAAMVSFEPLFCGTSPGDTDFWVTTYLFTDSYQVQDSEIHPEDGLSVSWKTEAELCDINISPFALYNRRAFATLKERTL